MDNNDLFEEDLFAAQADAMPKDLTTVATSAAKVEDGMLDKDNVVGVGVGVGYKITDGKQTKTPSVMVLVSSKLAADLLGRGNAVPETVESQPTDVLEVGHLFAGDKPESAAGVDPLTLKRRIRPARPGYSVGTSRSLPAPSAPAATTCPRFRVFHAGTTS